MRPFTFGVNVRNAASRREWVDKTRKVEDLGYATLTVPDHPAEMRSPIPGGDERRRGHHAPARRDERAQQRLPPSRPRGARGGNGPRLLTLAAQEADIVGLSGITFTRGGTHPDFSAWRTAAVDERVALVRAAAGDRFDRLELNALVQRVILTKAGLEARRAAAGEVTRGQLTPAEVLESPFVLIGAIEQLVDELQARRERWRISSYTVFEPAIEPLAPVVARLSGR